MTTIHAGLPGSFRATAAPEPAAAASRALGKSTVAPAMEDPWPVLKPPAMQEPWPKPTPPAVVPIVRPPVDGGPVVTRVDG